MAFLKSQNEPKGDTAPVKQSNAIVTVTETSVHINQNGSLDNAVADNGRTMAPVVKPAVNVDAQLNDRRAAISKVFPSHIDRLKMITTTLLPVRYSDKFYQECLDPERYLVIAFVVLYDSKPVGWIRCRIEPFPSQETQVYKQVYIQALGILAPFRSLGLAKGLLQAVCQHVDVQCPEVRSVYAHVWEKNEDALSWYERQSFSRITLHPQYYKRLRPSGAWVLRKELVI